MPLPGLTPRIVALVLAAALLGVMAGLLLAARAPLWPTARRPLLEAWDGYWRQSATGGLERFLANLECGALPDHQLQRAALVTPDSMQCRYEPAEGKQGDVVLVELVHSAGHSAGLLNAAYPKRVSTQAEQVALAAGTASGQRSTVRSMSAPTPGLDALVVRGKNLAVEVTCLDFEGGIDVAACHATQAAFFASWKGGLAGGEASPH